MSKKIIFLSVLSFTLFISNGISALTVESITDKGVDTSILASEYEQALPNGIILTPIFMPNNSKLTEEEWVKGIYHYTVQRLGFSRIAFHYLINSNGFVYSSNESEDRLIKINENSNNNIIIAFLAKASETDFSQSAVNNISNLITDIANRNNIKIENIKLSGLKFKRDVKNNVVSVNSSQVFGLWSNEFSKILDIVKRNYKPIPRNHTAQVLNTTLKTNNLVTGEVTEGSLIIKNTGNNNIYITDSNFIIAEKTEGKSSRFYLNNEWVSQSEFKILTEDQTIKPNQETEVKFKVKASLFPGLNKESFRLKMIGSGVINANEFELSLNVEKGSKRIVQIRNTETNFVRVRGTPSTVAEEIGRVASGERYIVLEEDGNGFLRIDLDGGRSGWIAGWLTDNV